MERSIAILKIKLYMGLGRFSPWILEPSHKSSVGQKTSIISGVPEPARKRNGVESITREEARRETLFLNQRFNNNISRKPKNRPMMMLGSLTVYGVRPNTKMDSFCMSRYGKSTRSPLMMPSLPSKYEFVADCISASDKPVWAIIGIPKSIAINAAPSNTYPIANLCLYSHSREITIFFTILL